MDARRRFRKARWVWLHITLVVTLATVTSPWWFVGVNQPTWEFTAGNGRAKLWWNSFGPETPVIRPLVSVEIRAYLDSPRLWFGWNRSWWGTNAWVPLWALALPIWGVTGLVWWLGPPIPRRGRCHGCGYSLEGLELEREHVRCPECGERRRIRMAEARILASYDDPPEDYSPDGHPPKDPGHRRERAD